MGASDASASSRLLQPTPSDAAYACVLNCIIFGSGVSVIRITRACVFVYLQQYIIYIYIYVIYVIYTHMYT